MLCWIRRGYGVGHSYKIKNLGWQAEVVPLPNDIVILALAIVSESGG